MKVARASGVFVVVPLAATVVAFFASSATAACVDPQAVADARAQIATNCTCSDGVAHGDFVRCARDVTKARVAASLLPKTCKGEVIRCAAKSTCGRSGAVTCCRTTSSGDTKCTVKPSAAKCAAPPDGSACTGVFPSCCDACTSGGCAPTTTTTLPECGASGFPTCNGTCGAGLTCTMFESQNPPQTGCVCIPDGSQPCESEQYPICNGTCPAGQHCGAAAPIPGGGCICVPDGQTACGNSSYPTCGGACPGAQTQCQAFRLGSSNFTFCGCVESTNACGSGCGIADMGVCDPGQACYVVEPPCGCAAP